MAKWMEFPIGATIVPIELTINNAQGGLPGELPAVRIRRISDNYYLDFADQTFKSAGQSQIQITLADVGGGRYRYHWNSSFAVTDINTVTIEYTNLGLVPGVDDDHISFTKSATILDRLSKSLLANVGAGSGNCKFTYILNTYQSVVPIPQAKVHVTSDPEGVDIIAGPLLTDNEGKVLFYLNKGFTYYFFREKSGYQFSNPDIKII